MISSCFAIFVILVLGRVLSLDQPVQKNLTWVFITTHKTGYELTVRHNRELVKRCKHLKEHATGGSTTIIANNLPVHTHPYNDLNTTYTANTTAVQSGTGTTVVQSITASPVDTPRTTGNNTTTAVPFVPPYYAVSYITNTSIVSIVTDVKLR